MIHYYIPQLLLSYFDTSICSCVYFILYLENIVLRTVLFLSTRQRTHSSLDSPELLSKGDDFAHPQGLGVWPWRRWAQAPGHRQQQVSWVRSRPRPENNTVLMTWFTVQSPAVRGRLSFTLCCVRYVSIQKHSHLCALLDSLSYLIRHNIHLSI